VTATASALVRSPSAEALAIETQGLVKSYGGVRAVDGVDLAVPAGSTYGFLGPNGSGKTTTIRVLLGLLNPNAGSWSLLGRSMPDTAMSTLPMVGSLVEGPAFYPWLSGWDNLTRLDAMGPGGRRDASTRKKRIGGALATVGLTAAGGKKYKAYSLGMRQRLGLAWALVRPRQLLILDEPTNGMDPQGTREIRHLIRQLGTEGTTVFLSSHLLSEIEQVCSHVGVMNRGKLLMQGPLSELRAGTAPKLRVEVDDPVVARDVLARMGMPDLMVEGQQVVGTMGTLKPEDCCRRLVEAGVGVRMLVPEQESLEDAFVALTGEGFDVAG
jgi:ABC-2 type transport system ATP-binding protein